MQDEKDVDQQKDEVFEEVFQINLFLMELMRDEMQG